jgi:hypothetical protein
MVLGHGTAGANIAADHEAVLAEALEALAQLQRATLDGQKVEALAPCADEASGRAFGAWPPDGANHQRNGEVS